MRALLKAQVALLVTVEVDIDWIDRDDRGQDSLVRLGEIAQGQLCPAYPAINRRTDLRIREVQFRGGQRRLGRFDACSALEKVGASVLKLFLGDGIRLLEPLRAVLLNLCEVRRCMLPVKFST